MRTGNATNPREPVQGEPAPQPRTKPEDPDGWPEFVAALRRHGLTPDQVRDARTSQGSDKPDPQNWARDTRDKLTPLAGC